MKTRATLKRCDPENMLWSIINNQINLPHSSLVVQQVADSIWHCQQTVWNQQFNYFKTI